MTAPGAAGRQGGEGSARGATVGGAPAGPARGATGGRTPAGPARGATVGGTPAGPARGATGGRTPVGPARGATVGGTPGGTARGVALEVLERIEEGAYANLALPGELRRSSLDARDRALVTELVYGTTRLRRSCDWLVDAHLRQPVPDVRVRAALRLGAYQLAFMRIPAHAAVSATVTEAPERARGLVNAVLRKVATGLPPAWPDLGTELSYPDWIIDRLQRDLGAEVARAALVKMNEPATVSSRGDGYIQDPASQWVAALVEARAGERVADLCAAPGGKATAMARGSASGPALVVAADLRPGRARAMRDSVRRLGLDWGPAGWPAARSDVAGPAPAGPAGLPAARSDVAGAAPAGPAGLPAARSDVAGAAPAGPTGRAGPAVVATIVADGRRPPLAPGSLDRVLVDAPCSGLGVLRRRADARWRAQPADVDRLARLQRALLSAAVPLVRTGGLLVYSVCTFTCAETIAVDEWLAAAHPELVALPPPGPPWTPWGRGALLLPQAAGTDGMFVLRLRQAAPA